jgi:hypothetical protein
LLPEVSKRRRITLQTYGKAGAFLIFHISLTLALFGMLSGLGGVVQAAGTTYYLDAEGGDDSNSGTSEAKPWATIDKANALDLDPGDGCCSRGEKASRATFG